MLFLVGVDHIIQHDGFAWPAKKAAIRDFSEFLRNSVLELGIEVLVEEFSEEALRINSVSVSILGAVAYELNLEDRFCANVYHFRSLKQINHFIKEL